MSSKKGNSSVKRSVFHCLGRISIPKPLNPNRDIRSIRKCLEEERDLPIGIHRYSVLQECLSFTATQQLQLYQRLRLRLNEIWIYDGVMTIDECIYAYQVSSINKNRVRDSADQIPVVFIPRKPIRTSC